MSQRIRDVVTLRRKDAGVVPVTENGRLTGMVTDRDIAIRVVASREGDDTQTGQVVQEISE